MELQLHRILWGVEVPLLQAAEEAAAAGFHGLESRVPEDEQQWLSLEEALARHKLRWNAEIVTGGDYVPCRQALPEQHLAELERALAACIRGRPDRVNCIAGLDAWDFATARDFLARAHELGEAYDLRLCFETHRSRILFNPWVTAALVKALPKLRLTADISHWCVVAERLMDSEMDTIRAIAPHVHHIHARVGYDQGPQVPHPAAPEYQHCLLSHQRCWEIFWQAAHERGDTAVTITPEFGADGYLHRLPFTDMPVADLWQINRWIAKTELAHFDNWQAGRPA